MMGVNYKSESTATDGESSFLLAQMLAVQCEVLDTLTLAVDLLLCGAAQPESVTQGDVRERKTRLDDHRTAAAQCLACCSRICYVPST